MNFTQELSAFQGAIVSADNVQKFSILTEKGGNEDKINFVVESLQKFLLRNQYLTNGTISRSSVAEVRKFALYIVLNAELPELLQLVASDNINTLIWTGPAIPKCLMCELMWNLCMENFIFEIISFAKPQFALEVAAAFIDNFKYFDPLDCLKNLQILSSACYILICRLHLFNFKDTELENISTAAYNNLHQCLKYYTTPPNNHKLNALRKVELYQYQGRSLYSLLQLLDECLTQFTSKLDANPAGFDIYIHTHLEASFNKDIPTFRICESSNNILSECLNNANLAMLDTCKTLVMDVTVDVFCCWSEFEENDKTMQQTVGELCYKVHNRLSNLSTLADHPLVSMFEQISCKPVEMKDKVNATEDDVIIQNINDNNEESKAWIKALIYKDKLCQNSELLNIVYSNLDVYNEDESYQLYSIFKKHVTSDTDEKDFVELLSVKTFEKCNISKRYDILEERFKNKIFIDMQITPQFKNAMTSIFNKLIASPDADLTDVLTVFLQNPQQVFTRIFNLASENVQQARIMLKVMKLLENFCDHYYNTETESCIIQITQKMFELIEIEAQQNNFIEFICGLKNANIISGTKLLLQIIMTNIHKALLNKDIDKLNLQLKLLQDAYGLDELMEYRAPMLAMLAQVLDVVRWKINTFCTNAPATLNLALDIQTSLLETYNGVIPDNQSQWLKSKLSNLKPLNMYYYRALWNPPGSNYLEIVSGMTVTDEMSLDRLTSWLSQVLCSLTQKEWCKLWDSLNVFSEHMILNIIHAAVAMLTVAEKSNRTENSAACIFYCYRNFMFIIRYKYITEPLTDDQVLSIIRKAAMITELVKEENIEEFGTVLMPIFAYLTEKQDDYNIDLVECLNKYLGLTKLSPMVNKVFVNVSFCNCDEPEKHLDDDTFPSSDQIWGMIGTLLATFACWIIYTKLKIRTNRLSEIRQCQQQHREVHRVRNATNKQRAHSSR